ncbi:MAG: hypothetical protein AAFN10_07910 [Bacteroidota bacterium]
MKRFLWIIGFAMAILPAQAQNDQSPYVFDYLYLRDADSTIIAGWILEQVPGEYVKIELPGGSIMVVEQARIDKITRERSPYQSIYRRSNAGQRAYSYRNKGFTNSFDIQFALPEGEWGNPTLNPMINYRLGYQWHRYIGTNVGAGLDFLQAGLVLPVFGELTGYLFDRPSTPFYSFRGGYGFGTIPLLWNVSNIEGGFMGQAMFGFMWHTRSRHQWQLGIGFKYQDLTIDRNGGWDWQTGEPLPGIIIRRPYQGVMLSLGLRI